MQTPEMGEMFQFPTKYEYKSNFTQFKITSQSEEISHDPRDESLYDTYPGTVEKHIAVSSTILALLLALRGPCSPESACTATPKSSLVPL